MDYSDLVDVLDAWNQLVEHLDCFGLNDAFVLDNVVEEFSLFHKLHDQKELLGGLYDFVKLHDIGVSDEFQNVDLPRDSLHVSYFSYFAFFEDFDRYILVGRFVDSWLDLPEGAFTDSLAWVES